jgi:hypothetical protein
VRFKLPPNFVEAHEDSRENIHEPKEIYENPLSNGTNMVEN